MRYVAALFEASGCDAVVTLEVHNEAAFENAFRCLTVALTAAPLLIDRIKGTGDEPLYSFRRIWGRQAGVSAAGSAGKGDGPPDRQGLCRKTP